MVGAVKDGMQLQNGALRHYARAAKCLPEDLWRGADAARMWRHPTSKALSRRAATEPPAAAVAEGSAEDAAIAAPAALWADREALEDDVARAMLLIEETHRLARQKKSGSGGGQLRRSQNNC